MDGRLLRRALLVLGPTEAALSMGAFFTVMSLGGWSYGEEGSASLLALASGSAFAVIAVAQMANAFVCRSETRPVWLLDPRRNPWVIGAVAVEGALLLGFLGIPRVSDELGGAWPPAAGWLFCLLAVVALPAVDALHKAVLRVRRHDRPS